jgi:6-phospho-beta-glucosidase
LYYYYFTRQAVAASKGTPQTRGQFLLSQQAAFYGAVELRPHAALAEWQRVRKERSASYMAENRPATGAPQRAGDDLDAGYEHVALDLMNALVNDRPTVLILNVRNGSTIVGLPPDAVVEVTCMVDAAGPEPRPAAPLPLHMLGLVQQVKAVEQLAIRAAVTGSYSDAQAALALHPLVDSVTTADLLLREYLARIPALAASLAHRD